jgi:germination protein M
MSEGRQDLEQRLRESLHARAEDVTPTPHLWQQVEHRLHRRRWTTRLTAVAATLAAVVAAVVVIPLVFVDPGAGPVILDPPEEELPPDETPPDEVPPPDGEPGDPDDTVVVETRPVTAYFVRADDWGLYVEPEVHQIDAEIEAVARAAIEILLAGDAHNPDLTTQAPEGTRVLGTNVRDRVLIVDLSDEVRQTGGGSMQEGIFAQQLAHTAAVFATVDAVLVYVEGQPIDELWGHFDWSEPIEPEPTSLSPIVIAEPPYGEAVPAGEVVLSGEATVYEATFHYRLYGPDGSLLDENFIMTTDGAPERGQWEQAFTLTAPGTYRFEAEEQDIAPGEGRPPFVTWVEFVVEE